MNFPKSAGLSTTRPMANALTAPVLEVVTAATRNVTAIILTATIGIVTGADDDRDRDSDDRREKRRREDGEEGAPEGKRRKEDREGSTSEARGERRDRSRDSDRRKRDRYPNGGRGQSREKDKRSRPSPTYVPPPDEEQPEEGDSEQRSVFVSQLAARLTARDLGYFFEDKLGDDAVRDARIVTDRLSRRSKGIGYVEFRNVDLVSKAIALTGTVVMGLPIKVQLTEAERNRHHQEGQCSKKFAFRSIVHRADEPFRLYVGSLHFQLTEEEIRQVFEPFGELEFVDLHRDPATGRSKGYCFLQYVPIWLRVYPLMTDAGIVDQRTQKWHSNRWTDLSLPDEQYLRVNTVHEKGAAAPGALTMRGLGSQAESLDEGGGNLNAVSRQALMQKLARTAEPQVSSPVNAELFTLAFSFMADDISRETEPDWEKSLSDDVKAECETKFGGRVQRIVVEKESKGEIYIQCENVDMARKAVANLDGRWFGGRQISASYISDAIMRAH
ncbi:12203_t:CDS:2 [Acaulospora colombiana]|uniref:12203_t:CDS:1 n=1 Tax=Acaulospora colombiana TaxID=27376 RepID=A0ACA9N186_9GLOM|nr:12203_t:CDS:2 [Acaulospora colombiana]